MSKKAKLELTVWQYRKDKNYPGYNLCGANCHALASLVREYFQRAKPFKHDLIVELKPVSQKQLRKVNNPKGKPHSFDTLRVRLGNEFQVKHEGQTVVVTLCPDTLHEFLECLSGAASGYGDFEIDGALWFWWS